MCTCLYFLDKYLDLAKFKVSVLGLKYIAHVLDQSLVAIQSHRQAAQKEVEACLSKYCKFMFFVGHKMYLQNLQNCVLCDNLCK